ncbi:hypothetical protein [Amycolatopsis panacis]|uniref:hypothetical protein n=1 Tax=Amycolatopsis panacis TaxID=2340917 RepID=UPI001F3286D1|nr:hypothetical protein [Amycolatopsis panacis]
MNGLAGAGGLLRLALRRDRVRIPVWTVVAAVTTAGAAAATAGVYPTAADRASAVAAINGVPALVALYGPVSQPTEGATAVFKLTMFGAAVVAVLTTLTVVRHTRADEESGRWELLRGAAVGRYAGLAAAGAALGATATGLGLGAALGLVLAGLPAGGSFVFGLGWTATGLVFGGFAAVMAQLSRGARAASEATLTMLVAAYLLRAAGDTAGPKWLSWLSPVGWPGLAEPYAGDRWWVLTLPLGTLVLAGVAAISLSRGRELGGGLVTTRRGADRAGRFLSGPVGCSGGWTGARFWRGP